MTSVSFPFVCAVTAFLFAPSAAMAAPDPVMEALPRVFARAEDQYAKLLEIAGDSGRMPRTVAKDGTVKLVNAEDWTSGFFPGTLWLIHEFTGKAEWKEAALKHTRVLEQIRHFSGHHDIGFMLGCSYGNALRLSPDAESKAVLLDGAKALQTRFDANLGLIRSWDSKPYGYPVIIDNMTNLELMIWSACNGGPQEHLQTALRHADATLKNHFRPDGSAYHVLDYDPQSGAVRAIHACQGMDVRTAWARGQAWAIHGFSTMHRETGNAKYLSQAAATADFVRNHPSLPEDKVPLWDFGANASAKTPRDAAAAAIIAGALVELRQALGPEKGAVYFDLAGKQLSSLASPAYLAEKGTNGNFLIAHCTGALPMGIEIDVPLNYADYYFLEALLRYRAQVEGKKRPDFGSLK
ncbi:MAG: glucuronyl hydrolase [Verrucomicrobiota bacterium]